MKATIATLLASALLFAAGEAASAADRTETVRFEAGASAATRSGSIKGYDGIVYRLDAGAGQVMQVLFDPSSRSCYFNVATPDGEGNFNGSVSGNEYSANLTASGTYSVQVYLMRNAARRNETCKYSISFEITG